jgi:hypothetical protein
MVCFITVAMVRFITSAANPPRPRSRLGGATGASSTRARSAGGPESPAATAREELPSDRIDCARHPGASVLARADSSIEATRASRSAVRALALAGG